jgi:hypothetical protein
MEFEIVLEICGVGEGEDVCTREVRAGTPVVFVNREGTNKGVTFFDLLCRSDPPRPVKIGANRHLNLFTDVRVEEREPASRRDRALLLLGQQ